MPTRSDIKVRVRLYAFLAERHSEDVRPGAPLDLDLPEGTTVASLVTHLGLPEDEVKLTVVNGRLRDGEHRLQAGDEVGLFPPIAGG
jgi:molybdopterin converting factor small subunit